MKDITDECMVCIEKNNTSKLSSILLSLPEGASLDELIDGDGFTLLHMAVFKNKTQAADALIKKAKEDIYQHQIATWVNLQTKKDKFTALHYASFRGNVELCKLLVDNGADVNVRNHFGLNVMHIAAQGDQPISLFFFK